MTSSKNYIRLSQSISPPILKKAAECTLEKVKVTLDVAIFAIETTREGNTFNSIKFHLKVDKLPFEWQGTTKT